MLIFLIMNLILLLNLIIAILSTTFAVLDEKKLALYYDGVIESIPVYKDSTTYGALIHSFAPFHMLILPVLPFYFILSKTGLRKMTLFFSHIFYLPILILSLSVFVVVNALLLVPAYFVALGSKVRFALATRRKTA